MIDSQSPVLIIQAKIGMGMRRDKNRIQVPHQLNGIVFPSTDFFGGLTKKRRNHLHQERKKETLKIKV